MALFKEILKKTKPLGMLFGSALRYQEEGPKVKGHLTIHLYEGGKEIYSYEKHNIIVNSASILIAQLLKDNTEPDNGISYLGVGSGSGGWDPFDPPAPTTSQTQLENEFSRKSIDLKSFVDPDTGEPTTTPTNIVDYSVTFGEAEAVGPIMELALFGGDATSSLNSGTMVNWRTFPVINKTNSMIMTIIFRITS